MRRLIFGFAWTACAVIASADMGSGKGPPTPSAATVVSKMIAAYGGRAVLESIKSVEETASFTVQGEPATITSTQELPDKFVQVVSIPAYHAEQTTAFDGARGWESDGFGHVKPLDGDRLALVRCQAINITHAVLHPDPSIALAVQSDKTIDGKTYIPLLFSPKGCPTATLYVDPKTYLVARFANALQTIDFSGYTTGPLGEQYPKNALVAAGVGTYYTTITSLKDNAALDESIFQMPSGTPSSPVPAASSAPAGTARPAITASPAQAASPSAAASPSVKR